MKKRIQTAAEIKADFIMYLNAIQVSEDFFTETIDGSSFEEFLSRITNEYIEESEEHLSDELDVLKYESILKGPIFKAFCIAYLEGYYELFKKEI